jgi:hypothetical protein
MIVVVGLGLATVSQGAPSTTVLHVREQVRQWTASLATDTSENSTDPLSLLNPKSDTFDQVNTLETAIMKLSRNDYRDLMSALLSDYPSNPLGYNIFLTKLQGRWFNLCAPDAVNAIHDQQTFNSLGLGAVGTVWWRTFMVLSRIGPWRAWPIYAKTLIEIGASTLPIAGATAGAALTPHSLFEETTACPAAPAYYFRNYLFSSQQDMNPQVGIPMTARALILTGSFFLPTTKLAQYLLKASSPFRAASHFLAWVLRSPFKFFGPVAGAGAELAGAAVVAPEAANPPGVLLVGGTAISLFVTTGVQVILEQEANDVSSENTNSIYLSRIASDRSEIETALSKNQDPSVALSRTLTRVADLINIQFFPVDRSRTFIENTFPQLQAKMNSIMSETADTPAKIYNLTSQFPAYADAYMDTQAALFSVMMLPENGYCNQMVEEYLFLKTAANDNATIPQIRKAFLDMHMRAQQEMQDSVITNGLDRAQAKMAFAQAKKTLVTQFKNGESCGAVHVHPVYLALQFQAYTDQLVLPPAVRANLNDSLVTSLVPLSDYVSEFNRNDWLHPQRMTSAPF